MHYLQDCKDICVAQTFIFSNFYNKVCVFHCQAGVYTFLTEQLHEELLKAAAKAGTPS